MKKYISKFRELKMVKVSEIMLGAVMLILMITQIIELANIFAIKNVKLMIYNISVFVIMVGISIYFIFEHFKYNQSLIDIQNLEQKNKSLLEVTDNVRSFKHDFNNIMQAMNGYIDVGDLSSLKTFFTKVITECYHINAIDLLNNKALNNPAIYSIFLSKYTLAKEKGIEVNIEMLYNLEVFKDNSYEVSRILGILLDNAIEACAESKDKFLEIRFIKDFTDNCNSIIIENSYDGPEVNTEKIYEKEYTTKASKGNTGLGLWKVKKIIDENDSINLTTTSTDTYFKQVLKFLK